VRALALIALATVPAAAAGYLLNDWADRQVEHPFKAAVFLVAMTSVLIGAELYAKARGRAAAPAPAPEYAAVGEGRAERRTRAEIHHGRQPAGNPADAERELETLPTRKAIGIGAAQVLALTPGVSRSGITISAGLLQGVSREAAARFSFLLSIPVILGAGVLKLPHLSEARETTAQLAAGFVASAVFGFLAVSMLIRMLRTRTLWPFIWYRLVAGSLFVVLLATVRK
jgi:undecaprenyl-diphosphatase